MPLLCFEDTALSGEVFKFRLFQRPLGSLRQGY